MSARFPLMEKPLIGFLLAFVAGSMDAFTFFSAKTFATVQSGNVVLSGYWLIQGAFEKFVFPIVSVLLFGFGSMFAGVIMTSRLSQGKLYTTRILLIEAAILAVAGASFLAGHLDPRYIAFAVSFVGGMQGNAFHKSHGMLYGNVAVTFVVQMAFNFLAQSFFKKTGINGEPNLQWSGLFFLVLLGFSGGAGIGALLVKQFGVAELLLPAAILIGIAIASMRSKKEHEPTDPTQGGLIG
jgi:uncharacterized membrane protein YoaK (UPF0700 family)